MGSLGHLSKTFQMTKDLSWHLAKLRREAFSASLGIAKAIGILVVGLKGSRRRFICFLLLFVGVGV